MSIPPEDREIIDELRAHSLSSYGLGTENGDWARNRLDRIQTQLALAKIASLYLTYDETGSYRDKYIDRVLMEDDSVEFRERLHLRAFSRLTDQMAFGYVAAHADKFNEELRDRAYQHLTDSRIIEDLCQSQYPKNFRIKLILDKLSSPEILTNIALIDTDSEISGEAARKLERSTKNSSEGQTLLAKVVTQARNEFTRRTAADEINDQSILASMAKDHHDGAVRKAAIARIDGTSDPNFLVAIAADDVDGSIRIAAAERLYLLEDVTGLTILKDNAQDRSVRAEADFALYRINNRRREAARNARVRQVEQLVNKQELFRLLKGDPDPDEWVRMAAVQNPLTTDAELLAYVARHDASDRVRQGAVEAEALSNQNVLLDVAINDREPFVRRAAVTKILEEELLFRVATHDPHEIVCECAINKIQNQYLLALLVHAGGSEVAASRLTSRKLLAYFSVCALHIGDRHRAQWKFARLTPQPWRTTNFLQAISGGISLFLFLRSAHGRKLKKQFR